MLGGWFSFILGLDFIFLLEVVDSNSGLFGYYNCFIVNLVEIF